MFAFTHPKEEEERRVAEESSNDDEEEEKEDVVRQCDEKHEDVEKVEAVEVQRKQFCLSRSSTVHRHPHRPPPLASSLPFSCSPLSPYCGHIHSPTSVACWLFESTSAALD